MFKRIAVAFDESPGAWHALASAISLAKVLNAQLHTVTVVEPSAYEPYVEAVPLFSQVLSKDRLEFYEGLQQRAAIEGERRDIAIQTHIVTGDEVEAVVAFLNEQKMDLIVIGLHRYTPRVARLWSTVDALEQEAPCSILGVH